jgi:hypothetical protein
MNQINIELYKYQKKFNNIENNSINIVNIE